jgi:DNA-binding XRE family transcriptional regulator
MMGQMGTTMTPQWTINDRLVKAREHAGLTQDEMATALGVSRKTVVRQEHANPPSRMFVLSYAKVTGVPVEWITDDDDDPTTQAVSRRGCYGDVLKFQSRRQNAIQAVA